MLFRLLRLIGAPIRLSKAKFRKVDAKGAEAANVQMKEILAAEAVRQGTKENPQT